MVLVDAFDEREQRSARLNRELSLNSARSCVWKRYKLCNASPIAGLLAVALAVIATAFSFPQRARRPRRPAR